MEHIFVRLLESYAGLKNHLPECVGIENGIWDEPDCVIAWHPLPEPYHAERSRE